ncbi:CLUMA_CG008110, isoform A [Clunio marinus]|uniref:Glycosyltransferase family 92 protein n=1 Tax=Clunio marinus TaxID=568069 RepID=A0A1J1I4C8_9DIPT|nr:CLUMA_CG008110, isoform A [Clunio marinus]
MMWNEGWQLNENGYTPYLLSCKNPVAHIPTSVSLVEKPCEVPTNNLKIIFNEPENGLKKSFAVCGKDMIFKEDKSLQLIEWIEILSILGVDKIFFYVVEIPPQMMKVLKYYESKGRVGIEFISDVTLPSNQNKSEIQRIQNLMVSLNDCFLKHMNEYNIISALDTDEMILPTDDNDKTWHELLSRKQKNDDLPPAYVFDNLFFLTDSIRGNETQAEVPEEFFFLQHVFRAQNFSRKGAGSKSFFNTEKVLVIHNHFPMICFDRGVPSYACRFQYMPTEFGRLQHYKTGCGGGYNNEECENFKHNVVKDLLLWKYKDEIIDNTFDVTAMINNN